MELAPIILLAIGVTHLVRKTLDTARLLPEWDQVLSKVWLASIVYFALAFVPFLNFLQDWYGKLFYLLLLFTTFLLREHRSARLLASALLPLAAMYVVTKFAQRFFPAFYKGDKELFETVTVFAALWLVGFGIYVMVQNSREVKQRLKQEERLREAEARKAELEHLVAERTAELSQQKDALENTLIELKAAQDQLVHAEKMASLGELTAGIAHEIQNPLNFVNNFAELSVELAHELLEELEKPDFDRGFVEELVRDLTQNQEKINHHGKRAANIVSGMLQHARSSTGAKEPADLNALADEYLRLSYHGLRAKDKSFNANMHTDLDPAVGTVAVVPQDLGRVLLNLINNAFYAVTQKKKNLSAASVGEEAYEPTVVVSTKKLPNAVEIRIRDNGTGIPDSLRAKIFQPFFTTKPTGQGTGLGLSLAYDIVTKGHGGTMDVETQEGEGTVFIIQLPLQQEQP